MLEKEENTFYKIKDFGHNIQKTGIGANRY